MIRKYEYPNGAYVTITTRKSNHAPQIYGWATIWYNRDYYNRGICEPSVEHKNYYLCDDTKDLTAAIDKFIRRLSWDAEELIRRANAEQVLDRMSESVSIQ